MSVAKNEGYTYQCDTHGCSSKTQNDSLNYPPVGWSELHTRAGTRHFCRICTAAVDAFVAGMEGT